MDLFLNIIFTFAKVFGIGLVGWLSIIILRFCFIKMNNYNSFYQEIDQEIIADGNNLFSSAIIYTLISFIAIFINVVLVKYIAIAIMFIGCLPSIFSIITRIPIIFINRNYRFLYLSNLINTFTPLIMTIYVFIEYVH